MPDPKINMDVGSEHARREQMDHFARFKPDGSNPRKLPNAGKKCSKETSSIAPYNNDSIQAQIGPENAENLTHDKANELESSGGYAPDEVILDAYDDETLNTAGSGSLSSHELLFTSVVFHRLFDNLESSSAFNIQDPAAQKIRHLVSILFGLMKVGGVLHEDKWLRQFVQSSEFDGSWPTVVCAVYQGMYLYQTEVVCSHAPNSTRHKTKTLLNSGLLTVSLFRKQHLQNLQCILATESTHLENFQEYNVEDLERLRLGVPKEASVLVSLLLTSIQTTINELQEWASQVVGIDDEWPSSEVVWDEAKIIKEGIEKIIPHAIFSKNIDENVMIRGMPLHILSAAATKVLQNRMNHVLFEWDSLPLQWRGSDLVDLDSIYRLGGLICIVEGVPYVFDETRCTSWCVIRHDLTGILLYKGLIDDAYDNKHRMFCEDSHVHYIGTTQVTTTDGITMVSCLHEDGTWYDGDFQKFALESHGTCEKGSTCARRALSGLPDSKFLENSSLQCNALQMAAFAFAAGLQHFKLQWRGGDGHIESEAEEGGSTCNLKACHVLFTKDALIVERDVVWRGDSGTSLWSAPEANPVHIAESEPKPRHTSSPRGQTLSYTSCLRTQ